MPKPLKRAKALQPISREHHHGLLLSWKIREGLKKEVDPERIKKYVDWFWGHHLVPHFQMEEQYIFPILGAEHELIKTALEQHKELERLFAMETDLIKNLSLIEKALTIHIRFEEQVLFNEIQAIATEKQMATIEEVHTQIEEECWVDIFWK
jgi:iron-sulfur cluster repair protein YtfE (RIC family)